MALGVWSSMRRINRQFCVVGAVHPFLGVDRTSGCRVEPIEPLSPCLAIGNLGAVIFSSSE